MSRVQLALNVSNLDAAIGFYSRLFAAPPAKVRKGYANFTIADPSLKLVLIETSEGRDMGIGEALNHLGVEVENRDEVTRTSGRLADEGLTVTEEHETTCCYAVQDKVWVEDPDGTPWEIYTVLVDSSEDVESCGDVRSVWLEHKTTLAPTAATCC
jgi:catechol 2,3-dioxygenase-like lactoylglutathione lyase family enzyme